MQPPQGPGQLKKDIIPTPDTLREIVRENPVLYLEASIEALTKPGLTLSVEQFRGFTDSLKKLHDNALPFILEGAVERVRDVIEKEFDKKVEIGKFGYDMVFRTQGSGEFVQLVFPYEVPYTAEDQTKILTSIQDKFPGFSIIPGFKSGTGSTDTERVWTILLPNLVKFKQKP